MSDGSRGPGRAAPGDAAGAVGAADRERLSPAPSRVRVLRRAWPLLLRPHRLVLLGAFVAAVGLAAVQLAVPVLLGVATDAVVDGDRDRLTTAAAAAGVAAIATWAVGLVGRRLLARAGEQFLATVRHTTVERLLARPLDFHDRHPVGELVARATSDVTALSSFVREWLPMLVNATLLLAVTLVVLFAAAWQLALVTLLYLPGLAVVAIRFRRAAGPAHAAFGHARANTSVVVHETLAARPWLQGLGATTDRERRAAAADVVMIDATRRALRADNRTSVLQMLQQVVLAAVVLGGASMADAGMVSVGTVATFALALRQLYQPLDTLAVAYGAIEGARADLARVVEVAEGAPLTAPADRAPRRTEGPLGIEVHGVSYSYDGVAPALRAAHLQIGAGEHVALVGTTGSGKSTLAKVIAGLYPPDAGHVRVGGRAVDAWPVDELRAAVVLVPQEVHVIGGTVADNLRLAPGHHDDASLRRGLERAGLGAWLETLPAGLATEVGDRGANLSAGERQVLAVARAVIADPAVLILDEATADVDPATERLLEAALTTSAAGRTTIVVAHRPATAARADRRIVVEAGRVSPPSPARDG